MTDKTELARRKAFIQAAHDVMKVWPGYAAHKFPEPDNRTDQCLLCDLRFSQQLLIEAWQGCRIGRVSDADFLDELAFWRIQRIHTAEMFDLGKATNERESVNKKKKQVVQDRRAKCKFKNYKETR